MDDDPWGEEPSWARGDGGGEDDDEGEDDEGPTIGASHVLVMIDCNPSMFVPSIRLTSDDDDGDRDEADAEDNGDQQGGDDEGAAMAIDDNASAPKQQQLVTPFEAALRATEKLIRGKVNSVATSRGGTRDGVGVMLFATKKFNPDEKHRDGTDGSKNMNEDGATAFKKSGDYNENGRPNASGDDSDSDSDEDGDGIGGDAYLTSFYHLIPLAPPGTEQTLQIRGCIPGFGGSGSRVQQKYRRDLVEEFADIEQGDGTSTVNDGIDSFCPLRTALHEASKAFVEAR